MLLPEEAKIPIEYTKSYVDWEDPKKKKSSTVGNNLVTTYFHKIHHPNATVAVKDNR